VGGSGDWDTPSNWSTGLVPTAADDVNINVANVENLVITHNQNNPDAVHSFKITKRSYVLNISAGSLATAAASSVSGALMLSGGTLSGPGNLTINGKLTWSGGKMDGTGTTTAGGGITFTGDSTTETLDTRKLNNPNVATWSGHGNSLKLLNGSQFNNQAAGSFIVSNDEAMIAVHNNLTNDPLFTNAGTFVKTAGLGTSQILVPFNNTGKVNVSSGTLLLGGGGNDTGTFLVPSGSSLEFGGNTLVNTSIGTSAAPLAGTLIFGPGTTTVAGSYNVSGTTTVDTGTVSFSRDLSIPTLILTGGTLTGPAAVTVTDVMTWKLGGAISGTGSMTLADSATLTLQGDVDCLLDTRTFINEGNVIWAGSNVWRLGDGATFNNQAGAIFAVLNDNVMSPAQGTTPTFNNAGTFIKAAGTGTTSIFVPFNNTGLVSAYSGTVQLGGGNESSGSFSVGDGCTLAFAGNTTLASGVSGSGNVAFRGGRTDVTGNYNISGSTRVVGSTVDFHTSAQTGTLSNSQGTLIIDNSTAGTTVLAVTNGGYSQTGGNTFLNGGKLTVAAGSSVDIEQGANFYGLGTVVANFTNGGNLYVGGSGTAGILRVIGNYSQASNGTLFIDIGGGVPGVQSDLLYVLGTASLSGTVSISTIHAFTPSPGGAFRFMTCGSIIGNFSTLQIGTFKHVTVATTICTVTA
jgi:hypothetical protein